MDKTYDYDETEIEEGITFKKIGYFFKKGWIRMVVYTAICILIATAIALPIRSFWKSEPVAQTTVEFIYDGIESGKAPDGSFLNTDNIISMTVLAAAVEQANLGSVITDISSLRQNMRVQGVNTDEYVALVQAAANGDKDAENTLRTYVMHPTSFDIIISNPEKSGLTDSQSIVLLDAVVQCYYEDFLKRYSVQNMFADDIFSLSDNQSIEFVDIYDIYDSTLTSISAILRRLAENNPDYVSRINNTSFVNLVSDFVVVQSRLELFNAYIASNNIWYDKAAARDALQASKVDINNALTPLEEYIASLNKQIALIQPNTITSGSDSDKKVTVSYPPEYFEYHAKLDEANREVRDYKAKLANIETRLEKLSDTEATPSSLIAAAKNRLKNIEVEASQKVARANAVINDYYQTQFITQSVRQTRPAIVTRRGMTFSLTIVYGVAIIAGLVIGGAVTAVKISFANAARAKAAKSEDNDASDDADNAESKEQNK